jgi:hypothetical protein
VAVDWIGLATELAPAKPGDAGYSDAEALAAVAIADEGPFVVSGVVS